MADSVIKPFLCENVEKALLRDEWEKWLRAFNIYLQVESVNSNFKRINIHRIEDSNQEGNETKREHCLKIHSDEEHEELITCQIGGENVSLIIDSGSRFNLISQDDWFVLKTKNAAVFNVRANAHNQFKGYASDEILNVICVFEAPIAIKDNPEQIASFFVIEKGRQSLLGRETATKLNVLRMGLPVNHIEIIAPFPKWKSVSVKLTIDPDIDPVKQPMRRIPVALEDKVNAKLEEAHRMDIIEPVSGHSPWISPMVIAFKPNGDIRLCLDMRQANRAILRENYPLPTFESFMTKLRNAKLFSRLDLKDAYHQLELDEASRPITTFITPRGLFRYKRLMFGINAAPEIFQRRLEELLSSCENVMNYIDDVIIFGNSEQEHDAAVKKVRKVFKEYNILLNDEKCIWKTTKIKFLGHILTNTGIMADPEKIAAIGSFRAPKNKEETRSFLGLVTYVGKFIPDLADLTEPLRGLLKKDEKFIWGPVQDQGFQKLKSALAKIPSLSYFDPNNKTRVIADASPVALGAVLLQFNNDHEPKIIEFASRSLTDVEKRYSQTEKESLALVWAVERYYFYLLGLEFELVTDHKPLETIFKPTSKPPARIERWLLRLQAYKFKVIYKSGKENIADSLSRLCEQASSECYDIKGEHSILLIIKNAVPTSIEISELAEKSIHDEEIVDAMMCLQQGSWNSALSSKLYPFRHELSTVGTIMLRGVRIVIPSKLRQKVLTLAHEGHPGESAMKRRLRAKVWWPQIDKDAERFVKDCMDCTLVSRAANPPPMKRTEFPNGPWLAVATDLLGPLPNNEYILVLIDYYSRYMEFKFLRSITSESLIDACKEIFCRLGYPKQLRTDNGRQYVSAEFRHYCKLCGIEQITTPPYWPQANGEVENMNKALVKRLKIAHLHKRNLKDEIRSFTFMYNVTPHGTTGTAPTELMFNRVIRDKIPGVQDLVGEFSDSAEKDRDCIVKQKGKEVADKRRGAREADIRVGDKVVLKNVVFPHKLTPNFDTTEYEVVERKGNIVKVKGEGRTLMRNVSHLKKFPKQSTPSDAPNIDPLPMLDAGQSLDPGTPPSLPTPEENETHDMDALKLKLVRKEGMWEPAPRC
ncbi:uncharacterized protein K02A2.6-like [Drosophila teissieri]|uniref:uncharacterized protein K02A2.6-like n=1 Tax=Drosophila teissieri TaxID=7243 RepID=UPI001CB9F852|nr:uncharacterized protein K02A2.6-like [Drosophila teissieri]